MSAPERPRAGTVPGGRRLPTTLAFLLSWSWLFFLWFFFGFGGFFSPSQQIKGGCSAPQLWLPHTHQATATSSKAPSPCRTTVPEQGHGVPPGPQGHGDAATSPCSWEGRAAARASPRHVQGSLPVLPLHARCASDCNVRVRAHMGAHVASLVHVRRVCTRRALNAHAQACEGTRANSDVHAQAADTLQHRCLQLPVLCPAPRASAGKGLPTPGWSLPPPCALTASTQGCLGNLPCLAGPRGAASRSAALLHPGLGGYQVPSALAPAPRGPPGSKAQEPPCC